MADDRPIGFSLWQSTLSRRMERASKKVVLFRLSRIDRVERLQSSFAAPDDFSLNAFARQSFGVFQEEPFDVVWRFLPRAAAEAREYRFHPDQEVEERSDGSLIVRFCAGGLCEMAWHLFTWGPDVEVLEPTELRRELQKWLVSGLRRHGDETVTARGLRSRRLTGRVSPTGR